MPYSEDAYIGDHEPMRHSGLGIASFIVAILVGLIEVGIIGAASIAEVKNPGIINEESPWAIAAGLGVCGGILLAVAGAGLGIAGLMQSQRYKLFAIIGLVFNSIIVLGMVGLIAIGLAMQAQN